MSTTELRGLLADVPFLVAVADEHGITAAADALKVPQPTVSRAMARLAARVGAPLLQQGRRGAELTPSGATLLSYARPAQTAVLNGVSAVRRGVDQANATVCIAFQHTFGRTVVPALVRALLAKRPSTHTDLRQGAREVCLDLFRTRIADAVLVSPPLGSDKEIRTLRLYAEPLVLAVPPDHPLAHHRRVQLVDLTDEPLLALAPGYGLRTIVDDLLHTAGINAPFVFDGGEDVQTLRGLVAAGLGIAILPPASQPPSDIIEIPIDDPRAQREIGVSWHTAAADPASAVAVLHTLLMDSQTWTTSLNRPASRTNARPH